MWRKMLFLLVPLVVFASLMVVPACTDKPDTNTALVKPSGDDPMVGPDPVILEVDQTQPTAVIRNKMAEVRLHYDRAQDILHYDCGDLHWEFSQGQVREYTSRDELIIRVEDQGWPKRMETYIFNGRRLDLQITTETPTQDQVNQFLAFYEADPAKNTLEANRDGETMLQLLHQAAPQIERIWQERDPKAYQIFLETSKEQGPEKSIVGRTCALAKACVATKCWFGGLANSVCSACTGVAVACYLMEALGWGWIL